MKEGLISIIIKPVFSIAQETNEETVVERWKDNAIVQKLCEKQKIGQ